MIVRDDSERGIPPLVAHQSPTTLADAPVVRGRMVPDQSFHQHCRRADALLPRLRTGELAGEPWRSIEVTDRDHVVDRVRSRLHVPVLLG